MVRPPLRVVIAEDDPDVRDSLCQLLAEDGFDVRGMDDGTKLVEALGDELLSARRLRVDLLITDHRMPGFTGVTIVESLRRAGWFRPVVVMSAFGDEPLRRRIDRMERVAFLPKPFSARELEGAMRRALGWS